MLGFSFRKFRVHLIVATLIAALASFLVPTDAKEIAKDPKPVSYKYDLVIYGGTPSGVMAALAAKRMGLRVVLISPTETVGGAMSNGVNATDLIKPGIIGGIPKEYFDLVKKASGKKGSYRVSASTAERVFQVMLANEKVEVRLTTKVLEATIAGSKITCLKMTSAESFCANEFIDSSYTGDLMPLTKTAFNLGRKDLFKYKDYQEMKPEFRARFTLPEEMTPVEKTSLGLLPFMQHPENFDPNQVDLTSGMPTMTFRFCMTKDKTGRKLQLYPEDKKYIPAWKMIVKAAYAEGCANCHNSAAHKVTRFFTLAVVAGRKWDANSTNSFTNFPIPLSYFESPNTRKATNKLASHYIESFMAFLQSDENPTETDRVTLSGFGMCSDEWTDNNNIPYEPYIREGRRLLGQQTVTANDLIKGNNPPDSIGLGFYPTDNKLTLSIQYKNVLYRDYTRFGSSTVFHLPYSIMVPRTGPDNLLVSVGVSASPLGYSALRMEPHYMQLGQAAGVAAAQAIKENVDVGHVNIKEVQDKLVSWEQRIEF